MNDTRRRGMWEQAESMLWPRLKSKCQCTCVLYTVHIMNLDPSSSLLMRESLFKADRDSTRSWMCPSGCPPRHAAASGVSGSCRVDGKPAHTGGTTGKNYPRTCVDVGSGLADARTSCHSRHSWSQTRWNLCDGLLLFVLWGTPVLPERKPRPKHEWLRKALPGMNLKKETLRLVRYTTWARKKTTPKA